jgi:O-methyltransferase involved in polyketide biosynthesis
VVILGAGYDSRCDRSNLNLGERGVKTYEVDAPGTHRNKLRLLEKCNIFSNDTTHVACDFVTQDWTDRLVDIGQLVFRSQICLYGRVSASFCHKKWWSPPPFKK